MNNTKIILIIIAITYVITILMISVIHFRKYKRIDNKIKETRINFDKNYTSNTSNKLK